MAATPAVGEAGASVQAGDDNVGPPSVSVCASG